MKVYLSYIVKYRIMSFRGRKGRDSGVVEVMIEGIVGDGDGDTKRDRLMMTL